MSDSESTLLPAIVQRRSPRAFDPREPSLAELEIVFEAARWAASSYNEQPWTYIVARRSEAEIYADALAGLNAFNRSWAQAAPVLGFALARTHFVHNGKPNRHAWHDVGAASAQLAVQAASLGLMMHQMAGIEAEVVRERFQVPDGLEVVAGFALGWPGDPEGLDEGLRAKELAPRTRKPLAEVWRRGGFG